MKQQLIEIRNNILEALNANDNMLAKMALNNLDTLLHKVYSKDENLENFINRADTPEYLDQFSYEQGIRVGAEYQKERMFSEEESIELLQKYRYDLSSGKTPYIGVTTKLWFEQYKKK